MSYSPPVSQEELLRAVGDGATTEQVRWLCGFASRGNVVNRLTAARMAGLIDRTSKKQGQGAYWYLTTFGRQRLLVATTRESAA